MNVIRERDGKTVHIIGDDGNHVQMHAHTYIGVWTRADGGVTLHADGRPAQDTVRTDAKGRVLPNRALVGRKRRIKRAVAPITAKAPAKV